MTLAGVLQSVIVVTIGLSAVGLLVIVGPARVRTTIRQRRDRLRDAVPYVALLGGVLLVNSQARSAVRELSWTVGIELTVAIYALEGDLVPWIQSFAATPLTTFFAVQYIYGYVFLLVFPLIAYLALADRTPFRRLCLAYTFNYAFGLVLYVLFVAYGPRNLLPGAVESLLYTSWPEAKLLTTQMNTNTNVFPSLHTSLSTTVVLLAYRTRRSYPKWFVLSTGIAASIVLATLYLGIHWGTDALAGVVLAVASVAAARRYDPVRTVSTRVETDRARRAIGRVRESIRG
jgi:membrane-associated phospholipid phosphatase